MAEDVRKSALFYQNVLGFKMEVAVDMHQQTITSLDEEDIVLAFVIMTYGEQVRFAIEERTGFEKLLGVPRGAAPSATVSFYFHVEDVDKLFKEVKDRVHLLVPMQETWYGRREFFIRDPDGYIVGFSALMKKDEKRQ